MEVQIIMTVLEIIHKKRQHHGKNSEESNFWELRQIKEGFRVPDFQRGENLTGHLLPAGHHVGDLQTFSYLILLISL